MLKEKFFRVEFMDFRLDWGRSKELKSFVNGETNNPSKRSDKSGSKSRFWLQGSDL